MSSFDPDPTGQLKQLAGTAEILKKIPPPSSKPIYSGSKEDMDMEKIRTSQESQIEAANRIRESLKTENQKWQEQLDIVTELHNQGRLTDEEFSQAQKNIQSHMKKTNVDWKEFSGHVAQTIEQAALMGRSWADTFKSLAIELAEAILKMTIFNKLQKDSQSGGFAAEAVVDSGGSIISSLGGLFGMGKGGFATGGTIGPGEWGMTGEAGPEPIYGGFAG
jgi:hypothetical protein